MNCSLNTVKLILKGNSEKCESGSAEEFLEFNVSIKGNERWMASI